MNVCHGIGPIYSPIIGIRYGQKTLGNLAEIGNKTQREFMASMLQKTRWRTVPAYALLPEEPIGVWLKDSSLFEADKAFALVGVVCQTS